MPEVEGTVDCRLLAQSDLLAKPLHSGHSNVVRIYHAKVRLSLEPDLPFLGHTGLWRFMHVLLLADDILRPTERSDHLGKADGARE